MTIKLSNRLVNKESKYYLILLAVYIYQLGNLLSWGSKIEAFSILVYLGPLILVYSFFYNNVAFSNFFKKPLAYKILLFAFFLMWIRFDINGANGGTFRDITGACSMFLFLIMLCNPYRFKIRMIVKWAFIAMFTGVIYALFFWKNLVASNAYADMSYTSNEGGVAMAMGCIYLLMSAGFIILCLNEFITSKAQKYTILTLLFAITIAMVAGRRGYSAILMLFIFEYLFLYLFYNKNGKFFFKLVLATLFILVLFYYYWLNKDSQFQMFTSRLNTDSRSDVFFYWDKEMAKNDLNWIIGKGVSGGYWDGDFGELRPGIENGVRHLLLKGGMLYLGSYFLLSIQAIYLAVFRSNNRLMKRLALYIFTLLVFMFVWGTPSFSFTYLFLWISYTWIFNTKIRNMNDYEIRRYLY